MKFLIAGLGNIGAKYSGTRHNIGFEIIDYLAAKHEVTLEEDRHAFVGHLRHKGRTFVLIKPTTFMNLSGKAVRYWLQKEKIKKENLLVIMDDLNLDFGLVRLKPKGGAGGHNGLKDIEQTLQTSKYARLRLGIGDKFHKGHQVNYVLGEWTDTENERLDAIIKHAAEAVLSFGTIGVERTMNYYNKEVE